MTTIAVLFTNLGPYHLSRINSLQKQCNKLGWNAIAIELARHDSEYKWQTKIDDLPFKIITVIPDKQLNQVSLPLLISSLYAILSEINPDILGIAGYADPAMLASLFWSIFHGKSAILFSETHEFDSRRFRLIEVIKSLILKGYKAALVGGNPQKRYLVKLGMNPYKIFEGYNAVGNEIFHPEQTKSLPRLIHQPYFLTVNRFIQKKNLFFLISSYAAYRQLAGTNAWDLVLCGDGDLRPQIEQQIADLNLKEVVHLPGFLQQNQLLPYFAHAGCFIHASTHEQWGLVVNEAMAAGLPVLVSNRCGCFEDLVIEGKNGFSFDPENNQQLTNLMIRITENSIDLLDMGRAGIEHIRSFSTDCFAQSLIAATKYILNYR